MKKQNLQKLTVSAMMIALSTVLSLIKVWEMPLGGAITLFSMLPVCLIGVSYGVKYAVIPCFLYGAIQMMLGGVFGWGLTVTTLIGAILFDYLFAFTALCLSGLFKSKGTAGVVSGISVACIVRFSCHFISGCIFFQSFEIFNNPYLYSVAYNGTFMLPELILTVIGALALIRVPVIKKIFSIKEM